MKRRSSGAGFTLIEAVVSIAVLGIIAGPLGSILVGGVRMNAAAEDTSRACMEVSSAVAQLMAGV